MHIHVISPSGEAKFWLEPSIELAKSSGFGNKEIRNIKELIEEKHDEFIESWKKHFGH